MHKVTGKTSGAVAALLGVRIGVCINVVGKAWLIVMNSKLQKLHLFVLIILLALALAALYIVWSGEGSLILFYLMDDIPVYFHVDALARVFVTLTSIIWVLVGIYAFVYMEHEGKEGRFFGFYILVYVVLIALELAGNLVTLYFFYELMTLTSMPLVLHNGSREAIMAALKYLFYSMCGAYCALFGIYFL